jgi:hypothetical protein
MAMGYEDCVGEGREYIKVLWVTYKNWKKQLARGKKLRKRKELKP